MQSPFALSASVAFLAEGDDGPAGAASEPPQPPLARRRRDLPPVVRLDMFRSELPADEPRGLNRWAHAHGGRLVDGVGILFRPRKTVRFSSEGA